MYCEGTKAEALKPDNGDIVVANGQGIWYNVRQRMGKKFNIDCCYRSKPCSGMSLTEIEACSRLFSNNYGTWSCSANANMRGRPVRLSPDYIRKMYVEKPNRYVAMMYDGDRLIGHVFYLRLASPWNAKRKFTFVQQLVLDKDYRGHRFGLKMLQSIFGLSDDDAWGLYTSNPLTVRALEDATFRHVSVGMIGERLNGLKNVLSDVFNDSSWIDSYRNGCVNTNFRVSHDQNKAKIKKAYPDRPFPFSEPLGEGEEYLAVIFNDQPVDAKSAELGLLTETSWEILKDAYSKMDTGIQKWASFAKEEVDFMFASCWVKKGDCVLDMGCGSGRHAIELAKRGCTVHGIDFSKRLICKAKRNAAGDGNPEFEVADIMDFKPRCKYDVVLCLYDVIGSSIAKGADDKVVKAIGRALKSGGTAVVSVMNLAMTRKCCRKADNLFSDMREKDDFLKLIKLPPSHTMQKTGEIFNGQLLLLNPETGVVYRKEQFVDDIDLPKEYVIADRRYTAEGLRNLFCKYESVDLRYVRAGKWDKCLLQDEKHAKEVLGVFRKKSLKGKLLGTMPKVA